MAKLLLLGWLAVCGIAAPAFANPADECLKEINESIENSDAARFEALVDIDGILRQGIDEFLAQMGKAENAAQFGPMLALMLSQAKGEGAQAIRTLLVGELRAFVLNGISSGAFAGKTPDASAAQGMLAPLFANASLGRKEIRGVGEAVKTENGWIVPFSVYDYGNGNDYPVIGRFIGDSDGARLVGVENLDQIFQQIRKEAQNQ